MTKNLLLSFQYEELKAECDELKALCENIRKGNKDENVSLLYTLEKSSIRIEELKEMLQNSSIVTDVDDEKINIGSVVTLSMRNGEGISREYDFTLIESKVCQQDNGMGFITIDSPIGKAIYGKSIEDSYSFKSPNGALMNGQILNIKKYEDDKDKTLIKTQE